MRLLKGFIITIFGFFVVITLVSLLMPSTVVTSRTISIAADQADIMQQVGDLHNWRNWHPLFVAQPIEIARKGSKQEARWMSNGKENTLALQSATPDEARFTLLQTGENAQENKISLLQYKDSVSVYVEWSALTRLKWYLWEKFSGIFVDKVTGPGYEAALASLKDYVEKLNREN